MDFKGDVLCGAGRRHPLTVLDDHSPYSLTVAACANERANTVEEQLIVTFRHCGLPRRMLVDNEHPGAPGEAHGYTPLTVWLPRLGMPVSHSRPHHPQTLGQGASASTAR